MSDLTGYCKTQKFSVGEVDLWWPSLISYHIVSHPVCQYHQKSRNLLTWRYRRIDTSNKNETENSFNFFRTIQSKRNFKISFMKPESEECK